jgi:uncharacterized protein (DUF2235 family)
LKLQRYNAHRHPDFRQPGGVIGGVYSEPLASGSTRHRIGCSWREVHHARLAALLDLKVGNLHLKASKPGSIVRGGLFGYGIDDAVINAYEWLIENFDDGDEIFIFGFSRGAYTARSLSGFISRCGLLVPGSPLSIRQLYNRYRKGNEVATLRELHQNPNDPRCGLEEKRLVKHGRPISVKFTGVWDTVGALGDTGDFVILTGGDHDFLDVNLRRSDEFAFHALAIDEHREDFAATLFTRYAPKISPDPVPPRRLDEVEQRWFVGDHSNVGGGTDNDLLPQVPLKWMMGKAALHGLAFRSPIELEEGLTNALSTTPIQPFLKALTNYCAAPITDRLGELRRKGP